ncbi:MAG TPA: DUF4199 domain-containing protein [Bacteroidales bacterium]|nr:DUF4199 domain-containing protein [Bacteroidales bacterium]HSA43936.1 DUF4199 domain-containing protein [Bacteroidales bacterium]
MKNIFTEIKWAVIFMVMLLLWMLLEKVAGLHDTHIDKHQYLTMLFIIPAILVYVLAIRDKKKRDFQGQINFKQAFVSGVIITVIIALFSPLTQWIISFVITPSYFDNVIAYSVESGYHASLEEARDYFNYRNYAIQSIIWALVTGIVTSAVVAFFLKSKTGKT